MSIRVRCPTCYSECRASEMEKYGCWYCIQSKEREAAETAFEDWMELDERDRWRQVFKALNL